MTRSAKRYQKGAIVVMFALYTVVFIAIIALAVNVYLIGNALIQQRTAVEYVAMSVLKIAKDPAIPFPAACTVSDLTMMNCILDRAEVAGRVAVGFSPTSFYLPPGELRMVDRESSGNGGPRNGPCVPFDSGDDKGAPPTDAGTDDGMRDDDFCWPSYKVQDESRAELVMGNYTQSSTKANGVFSAAEPSQVAGGSFNAIKLRFHLDEAGDMKIIAPLVSVFGSNIKLKFSSAAIAYVTPSGKIELAIDPKLSMD